MRLGMFDPPEIDPYSKIDENAAEQPGESRSSRAEIANESMVLLKNDGILPLKTSGVKIAVVGPLANQTKVLLGNYNGTPTYTVSILDGTAQGVLRRHHHLRFRNAVPGPRCGAGARLCSHRGWQARHQGQFSPGST